MAAGQGVAEGQGVAAGKGAPARQPAGVAAWEGGPERPGVEASMLERKLLICNSIQPTTGGPMRQTTAQDCMLKEFVLMCWQ